MTLINRHLRHDLGSFVLTTGLGTVAAVTPRRAHRRVLAAAIGLDRRLRQERPVRRSELRGSEEMVEAVLAHRRAFAALRIEEAFCQGRGIFRRGWAAEIRVTGMDHVHEAHAHEKGLVLWQMTFLDLTPAFIVLAEAGYPVTHLSTIHHRLEYHHALSRRLVAPALVRGEIRALKERVMIPPDGGLGYLKRLRSIVQDDHGTVSIRGDFTSGQRQIDAVHLGNVISVPTGAPSLAHLTGAPLLTAAVVRRGLLEHEVLLDEPISAPRDMTRREFQYAAVEEFASRLEARAREFRDSRPIIPFLPELDPELRSG